VAVLQARTKKSTQLTARRVFLVDGVGERPDHRQGNVEEARLEPVQLVVQDVLRVHARGHGEVKAEHLCFHHDGYPWVSAQVNDGDVSVKGERRLYEGREARVGKG